MKVLAISGWKGSGKDTIAGHLIEKYGAVRVSFADPLKDMASEEYGIARESLDIPEMKEVPILSLPVNPKDAYSRMVSEFLVKEFRSTQGQQPEGFEYQSGEFYGKFGSELYRVYWTPRALAILKGSTNRAVRSNYWVQRAIQKARESGAELIVISDLRYKSELSQLKDAFGSDVLSVRVDRFDTSPSSDPSERDLDDATFDARINNRSTKEEAFAQASALVEELLNTRKSQAV